MRTLLVASSLVASRVLDFWSTYRVTPALRGESNPIVRVLGAGWTGFVLSNAVLDVAITVVAWCDCARSSRAGANLARHSRSTEQIRDMVARLRKDNAPFLADCIDKVGPHHGVPVTNAAPGFSPTRERR